MDRDRKHSCKFCFKSFSNGKALGGHMRSHVPTNSSKADAAKRKITGFGSVGYGLRENPKKTWRLSDSTTIFDEKLCRECGREFQSWKALFGHMRSHAEKEREDDDDDDDGEGLIGGAMVVSVPRRKKRSSRRSALKSVSVSSSSSVTEYEKEQEEAAIVLMMLSRDVGNWGIGFGFEIGFGFSHVADSSDKNSVVDHQEFVGKGSELGSDTDYVDPKENSDDESFKKRKKKMVEVCNVSELGKDPEMGRSSKYECTTCNKSFLTYQALGGHRAAHKRMKDCFPSKGGDGSDSNFVENEASVDYVSGIRSSYQCLTCGKVFGSGQALGGHKRSHFVMASSSSVVMPDLIDLNLPARIDESSSKGKESDSTVADIEFDSWWARSSVQRDAMFGMISS